MQGAGCRVQGAGCRVQGAGCRVQGAGCGVWGAGCRLNVEEHDCLKTEFASVSAKGKTFV